MISRRQLLSHAICGCFLCVSKNSLAKPLTTDLGALIGSNYQPVDFDEKGIWHACDTLERNIAESDLLLRASDLTEYTALVLERLLGKLASDFRIYIVRDAAFNASMTPNGMMIVNTGLLARVHSEAQYATVIGHEAGHYLRKHSIDNWRDIRTKSAIGAFASAGANAAAGYSASQGYSNGQSWIDLASSINQALLASIFSYKREQESEADAFGIKLLSDANYTPESAAQVWGQLIAERQASAKERNKRYRENSNSAYSTHPPSEKRMRDLADTAAALSARSSSTVRSNGESDWKSAVNPYLPDLFAEQIKLNDAGASLYLIESHAQAGWTGLLRFNEGEIYRLRGKSGDASLAETAYATAVTFSDAPPEAWRANGYSLLKRGSRIDGISSLNHYLELKPNAPDAAMVRFSISQNH